MRIYLGGSITGLTGDVVFEQFEEPISILSDAGYKVLHPMIGKDEMRTEEEFKSHGYQTNPLTRDEAIYNRDRWMIEHCDVVMFNLLNAERVSIGSMFEMAWANDHNKMVITLMQSDNIHQHVFVKQASSVVLESVEEAIEYLEKLV